MEKNQCNKEFLLWLFFKTIIIYRNCTDCLTLKFAPVLGFWSILLCERRGRDGGGEQEEENSKTWLDPTDLESLVSTTCGKKFPTKHLQRIYSSAANNNWLDLSDDLISGCRRSIDRSGFLPLLNTQCLILTIKLSHYALILVTATKHESIGFFENFFEKLVFKKMTFIIQ